MLMGNLMEIHVYTLLRLSHLIYFYIDAEKFLIEICDLPVLLCLYIRCEAYSL